MHCLFHMKESVQWMAKLGSTQAADAELRLLEVLEEPADLRTATGFPVRNETATEHIYLRSKIEVLDFFVLTSRGSRKARGQKVQATRFKVAKGSSCKLFVFTIFEKATIQLLHIKKLLRSN